MSKVDEALVEIQQAIQDMVLPLEVLEDYLSLDVSGETRGVLQQAHEQYLRRRSMLVNAWNALTSLVGDGYPTLEIPDVSLTVHADLLEQQKSIEAALSKFRSQPATGLNLEAETPQPK